MSKFDFNFTSIVQLLLTEIFIKQLAKSQMDQQCNIKVHENILSNKYFSLHFQANDLARHIFYLASNCSYYSYFLTYVFIPPYCLFSPPLF